MENVPASEQQQQPTPSPSVVPEARPPNATTNDNSNPQQGSGGSKNRGMTAAPSPPTQHGDQRQEFKIPPTKKDARKLFVGGLPSDGMFGSFLLALLVMLCISYSSLVSPFS